MRSLTLKGSFGTHRATALAPICLLLALLVIALVVRFGSLQAFDPAGVATASRALNQFMAVTATSLALIIPLTANLYTPRLVKLYVSHPMIVSGLAVFLLGHTLTMALHFFPQGHPAHAPLIIALALVYLVVLAAALPYLYGLSQFLRPSFFMPMLTRRCILDLQDLGRKKKTGDLSRDLFETANVVANIALTAVARGDRQLVLLSLQSLHVILTELVGSSVRGSDSWRNTSPVFAPGMAQEGQDHLVRQRVWPEAYILSLMLKIMEAAGRRQNETLAEVAGRMVDTAQLALILDQQVVVDLHVMALNSLLREAVEEKDLRRFQNLSYHYRLLVEAFQAVPERMLQTTHHLIHYGTLAARAGLGFGLETVVYDIGELVLNLGKQAEERAVQIVQVHAGPLWQDALNQEGHMRKTAWRTLLRLYWEARVLQLGQLSEAIFWRFLSDEAVHREQLELILDENRELHYEFNDRLMRFAHLSEEAESSARTFLASW